MLKKLNVDTELYFANFAKVVGAIDVSHYCARLEAGVSLTWNVLKAPVA